MGFQKGLTRVGLAKQTVKGTPVTPPGFAFGVRKGNVLSVAIDQKPEDVTLGNSLVAPNVNRTKTVPGAEFTTRAYPKTIGLMLYGALGAIADAGSNPYTHTITPGTDIPYLTLTGESGGTFWTQVKDAKVDKLELSWDNADPLEVKATLLGTVLSFPGSFGSPTNDETLTVGYTPVGGTLKLDVGSSTAAVAPITGGSITIANSVEAIILSAATTPDDVFVGEKLLDTVLRIVPNDLTDWRKAVTGTSGGSAISQVPVYGSFDLLFSIDANTTLQIASTRTAFLCDFPDADPGGGPVELSLPGAIVLPASGAALTATVKNSLASY